MQGEVKIRVLDESDLDAVAEIDQKVLGKERRAFWRRKIAYAGIYPRPVLVAEIDGKIAGFILGFVSGWEFGVPDNIGWIDTVGVDPAYQLRGIGRALFNTLIEIFKRSGRDEMPETEADRSNMEGVNFVYTLAGWNDWELLQFYHAMGFKKGEMLNLEIKL